MAPQRPACFGGSPAGEDLPGPVAASRRQHAGGYQTDCVFLAIRRRSLFERHLEQLEALRATLKSTAPAAPAESQATREIGDRMWTLGLLLAGVMHEVRNPLTYLQGSLQLLGADLENPDPKTFAWQTAREYVREAAEGASRILELVRAVGTVSHLESSRPMPVDLARVVDTAVKLVRHRLMHSAKLELDGPKPGPVVMAEEPRLVQVVMNLLINAGQALANSSSARPVITVRHQTLDDAGLIEVIDNGPGVPPALRERIFQPFFTTKPVGEGNGLGLAISREIVTSLGGSLELSSPSGGGAAFRISFPLAGA